MEGNYTLIYVYTNGTLAIRILSYFRQWFSSFGDAGMKITQRGLQLRAFTGFITDVWLIMIKIEKIVKTLVYVLAKCFLHVAVATAIVLRCCAYPALMYRFVPKDGMDENLPSVLSFNCF